jgi:hypothetical protein
MEEYELLNDRQKSQAEDLAELALEYGQFKQDANADGAHYATAAQNPFKAAGIACKNCVFYNEEAKQCQIVEGILEDDAVCKLWIIPEIVLTNVVEVEAQRMLALKKAKVNLLSM